MAEPAPRRYASLRSARATFLGVEEPHAARWANGVALAAGLAARFGGTPRSWRERMEREDQATHNARAILGGSPP